MIYASMNKRSGQEPTGSSKRLRKLVIPPRRKKEDLALEETKKVLQTVFEAKLSQAFPKSENENYIYPTQTTFYQCISAQSWNF